MPLSFVWHGINQFSFLLYIYILFINNLNLVYSQPSDGDHCILDVERPSTFDNSRTCDGALWDGFLDKNCSGRSFCNYLYALGLRANQTGKILLNSDEQRKCESKNTADDALDCRMEKLMAGGGSCSDFSTEDVQKQLGNAVEKMRNKCRTSLLEERGDSCASCLKSWDETKEMNVDSEICSFTVLITMTSTRIKDEIWVAKVFNCLGNQQIEADSAGGEHPETLEYGLSILIGGAMGLLAVVICIIYILTRRRKIAIAPVDKHACKSSLSNLSAWKSVLTALSKESAILKVPIEEIHSATNNLHESNFIGQGTTGKVYRGVLFNHKKVSIKQITDDRYADTLVREIRCIMNVRHQNLVALVGYCQSGNECFLIFELCPNGNLAQWLHGQDKVLSWIQRLEIAIGSARGLWFLHTFPEGCIIHRDIKPTNILLSTNFEAKLSDFGLSKVMKLEESSTISEVRGNLGYIDPNYQSNHQVSSASDIYSFGVVLLQILSGRKVININMDKPMPLDKIAKSLTRNGGITKFADPNLHGDYSMEAFQLIFELAVQCTGAKPQRPSAAQVLTKLEEAFRISIRMKASPHTTPNFSLVS